MTTRVTLRMSWFLAAAAALGGVVLSATSQQQATTPYTPRQADRPSTIEGDEAGFQPIFDGKTLTGWEGNPTYWRVENGALVGEITPQTVIKSNTFIIWRGGHPKDFELKLDYRSRPRATAASTTGARSSRIRSRRTTVSRCADMVESVAIAFLHAYASDVHERAAAAIVRERAPGLLLTLSSEILPEVREFERTSTAVTNAYVMPVMSRYLGSLETELRALGVGAPILVMQSNGGVMTAASGRRRPVHVIESGPAAGVIATAELTRRIGQPNAISIDMGGTTAKASVIEGGALKRTGEFEIGGALSQGSRLNRGSGFLLRVPAIDIAEVGAGGGSIVRVDDAGQLHVGPRSAGAIPGPACYGQGGKEATLTDANVVLGYLHPDRLPSGLVLDAGRARDAIAEQVARPLDLTLEPAAHGVYLVGCARMARAVRAVTIERGRDARDFVLVAFGGSGPLFAAEMARSLGIATVLIPPAPGVFSAIGLIEADSEHHLVRSVLRPLSAETAGGLAAALRGLEREAEALLRAEGYREPVVTDQSVDLKYEGQSFELTVPLPAGWRGSTGVDALAAAFAREHERTYGHAAAGDPIQVVNLRVTARLVRPRVRHAVQLASERAATTGGMRRAYFGREHGVLATPVLARMDLGAPPRPGPLLIDEYDATTLVPPGATACLDDHGDVRIATGAPS